MDSEQLDLLSELVTHPGWRVLKRDLEKYLQGLYSQVLTPAADEFDLIRKESKTAAIQSHKQFISIVEDKVEKYNRTVRRKT